MSPSTVLSWIDRGLLHAHRTPGGHRRVEGAELLRFLRDGGLPVPPELVPVCSLLLVDDDAAFLRATERDLKHRIPSLEVQTAEDAMEALLRVGTQRPDAVLLDAHMPGMNGVEVCRRLHEAPATRSILLLAVTGDTSPALAEEFRAAGAADCYTKPLDYTALLRRLGLAPPGQD
ncbi:MAG: response regulator [Polyangiaceae bacterium]|nr:response regulator [Polyangiaceae bacterium]